MRIIETVFKLRRIVLQAGETDENTHTLPVNRYNAILLRLGIGYRVQVYQACFLKRWALLSLSLCLFVGCSIPSRSPSLVSLDLDNYEFVDLTHSFHPGIPHWSGFPDEHRETIYTYSDGFAAERYCLVGQWGTHVDAPSHFVQGGRAVDEISPREMVLPLVILDVHKHVECNPDYAVNMCDVRSWESRHGRVPMGAFVALRTDWSTRWPNATHMRNVDDYGVAHYPGWSKTVLEYLLQQRAAAAIGHETTDTDPGKATSKNDYSLERYVLASNRYQIELLTNLNRVPEYGAIVVVAFPKPKAGTGFPARVFAIVPPESDR